MAFGGTGRPAPRLGGLCVAFDAVESLRRQWACEFGEHGVRFVNGFPSFFDEAPGTAAGKYFIPGDAHFSAAGHRLLYEEVKRAVGSF